MTSCTFLCKQIDVKSQALLVELITPLSCTYALSAIYCKCLPWMTSSLISLGFCFVCWEILSRTFVLLHWVWDCWGWSYPTACIVRLVDYLLHSPTTAHNISFIGSVAYPTCGPQPRNWVTYMASHLLHMFVHLVSNRQSHSSWYV